MTAFFRYQARCYSTDPETAMLLMEQDPEGAAMMVRLGLDSGRIRPWVPAPARDYAATRALIERAFPEVRE